MLKSVCGGSDVWRNDRATKKGIVMLSTVPGTEFSPSLQKRQARYWEQEVTDVASQQLAEHKSAYQQVIAVARIYF